MGDERRGVRTPGLTPRTLDGGTCGHGRGASAPQRP